jgi:hypothetical protein
VNHAENDAEVAHDAKYEAVDHHWPKTMKHRTFSLRRCCRCGGCSRWR